MPGGEADEAIQSLLVLDCFVAPPGLLAMTTAAIQPQIIPLLASFDQVEPHVQRHGRTCSGHPRLALSNKEDVDARDGKRVHARLRRAMRGHDEGGATQSDRNML